MKPLCVINCLLFFLVLPVLAGSVAVAQQLPVTGVAESRSREEALPDDQLSLQESSRMSPELWSYAVAATDGAVRCEELSETRQESCKNMVDALMQNKWVAKGQSVKFKPGSLKWKLSVAMKERNCLSWEEPIKTMCQVFVGPGDMNERVKRVQDVYNKFSVIIQNEDEKDRILQSELKGLALVDLATGCGLVAGYFERDLDRRKTTCQAFFNAYHVGDAFKSEYFLCDIFFGNDPVKIAQDIDRDLTVYRRVQMGAVKNGCDMIKHPTLRDACGR